MKESKEEFIALAMAQFLRIINKYNQMHKKAMSFGTNIKLQPGEIHTIEAISHREGINVTDLARVLGITKGGVSQMLSRLERKKLIVKTRAGENDKEVRIDLSDLGRKAHQGHLDFHLAMYQDFSNFMDTVTAADINLFRQVLGKVENHLDRIMKIVG
jgi:DNA-binding MarR family transcriptional regulator